MVSNFVGLHFITSAVRGAQGPLIQYMSPRVPVCGLLAYFDFCRRPRPKLKDNLFKKYSLDDNVKGIDNPKLKLQPFCTHRYINGGYILLHTHHTAHVVSIKCPEDLTLI